MDKAHLEWLEFTKLQDNLVINRPGQTIRTEPPIDHELHGLRFTTGYISLCISVARQQKERKAGVGVIALCDTGQMYKRGLNLGTS